MSEYELLELTGVWKASIANAFTIMVSLVFAYLVAANTIGKHITKVQVTILNFLFLYAFVLLLSGIHIDMTSLYEFQMEMPRFQERASLRHAIMYPAILTGLTMMPLASLYYMWSVRHP